MHCPTKYIAFLNKSAHIFMALTYALCIRRPVQYTPLVLCHVNFLTNEHFVRIGDIMAGEMSKNNFH